MSYYRVRSLSPVCVGSVQTTSGRLICGTGIGMSITANKFTGIRAALIHDPFTAHMAKQHNDANVICFGSRLWDTEAQAGAMIYQFIKIFLGDKFDTEGRHSQRLALIAQIESNRGWL